MTFKTIKRKWIMMLVNHVYAGTGFFPRKRRLLRMAGWNIGENTQIVGPVYCTGKVSIGDNCWIGKNFSVNGNGSVTIGDNCDLAPDVAFYTGGHEIGNKERRAGAGRNYSISVGNGCWIGARASIVRDVSIGDGSVIGACACVINNVPSDSLVGGVPAKLIRDLNND